MTGTWEDDGLCALSEVGGRSSAGSRLAIDESERRHARKVVLEVRKSNNPAINFYLGFDFRIAGERRNYYSNPVEDAYVMELDISD